MSRRWHPKESELGPPITAWLQERGFDVWPEVCGIDLVGIRDKLVICVELKATLSFDVLRQAWGHVSTAHWAYAAVPRESLRTSAGQVARRFCDATGVGILAVDQYSGCDEWCHAGFNRKALTKTTRSLVRDEHRKSVAGSPSGPNVWTPFKDTREKLTAFIAEHPGSTIREVVDELGKCHYATSSSFRTALAKDLGGKLWPGIRHERSGKVIRLYPVAAP